MSPRNLSDPSPEDLLGGRYRLEQEIGRGGMGTVWLGRDEVLGRRVALKQIGLIPGAGSTDLTRAEREAQVSARLQHAHVVAVFDLVVDGDDRWLVMEYVDGATLAALVHRRGPLQPETAAALLLPVADALLAAHRAGIVHRDVKPSNVLVGFDGLAKLSDFGIARRDGDSALTQPGVLLGSPTYLAPEVAAGEPGGTASDVWSFGATLGYALSGRPPYPSEDNVLQTLHRIVREDPAPVPGAGRLAAVLAGTLEKDPARRWSMDRARRCLEEAAQPDATTALMASPPAPPRRRLPAEALLLGAALLLALGVAAYAVVVGRHPSGSGAGAAVGPSTTPSTTSSAAPSRSSPRASHRPTAAGMKAFIARYVATISADPDRAWRMLTPAFQRASGGLATYRAFWRGARNGRILDISADPGTLAVSYHVHFDHLHNGPGPTVLDLAFDHGGYRIAAEHTVGFHPRSGTRGDNRGDNQGEQGGHDGGD